MLSIKKRINEIVHPSKFANMQNFIIIPNWNGKRFLKTCFDSLKGQTYRDFEIVMVDNGSTDGSVGFIRENYPEVKIIELAKNKGFCVGVNTGIKSTKGECVALLNNDVELEPRWLEELVKVLKGNPEIGFCASKMLNFYNRQNRTIDSAGIIYTKAGKAFNRGSGQEEIYFDKEEEVFGACAGAALYRRKMLEEIGYFDERFYAYDEDVDLSFHAQLMGYRCLYVPTAIVYHFGQGTSCRRAFKRTYLINKNTLLVLFKNLSFSLLRKNILRIIRSQLSDIVWALRNPTTSFLAVIKGKIDAIFLFPAYLVSRLKNQRNRKVPIKYLEDMLSDEPV